MFNKKIFAIILILSVIVISGCEPLQNLNKEEYSLNAKLEKSSEVGVLDIDEEPVIKDQNGDVVNDKSVNYYENESVTLKLANDSNLFEIKEWKVTGSPFTEDKEYPNSITFPRMVENTYVIATYKLSEEGPFLINISKDISNGEIELISDGVVSREDTQYEIGTEFEIKPIANEGFNFDYVKLTNHTSEEEEWLDSLPIYKQALGNMTIEANFYSDNRKIIEFADFEVKEVVRKIISKEKGEIFQSHLDDIEKMDLNSKKLTTLKDLAKFDNLKELNLFDLKMGLVDLRQLDAENDDSDSLNSLEILNLSKINKGDSTDDPIIEGLEIINSLSSLRILRMNKTYIDKYDDNLSNKILNTSRLSNLEELYLTDNNISNIRVFADYTDENIYDNHYSKLKVLNLNNNQITSISDLRNLIALEELYLNNNSINSIESSDLDKFSTLRILNLADNNLNDDSIKNLLALPELSSLEEIDLSGNANITNFNNLGQFENLDKINMSNAGITDITDSNGEIKFKQLDLLNLSNNNISNVNALNSISYIGELKLSYNPLTDISALESIEIDKLELLNIPYSIDIENTINVLKDRGTDVRVTYN